MGWQNVMGYQIKPGDKWPEGGTVKEVAPIHWKDCVIVIWEESEYKPLEWPCRAPIRVLRSNA